ncbi:MAG: energy transducer TonB, partial [Acidobacteriota bacterium]
LSAFLHGLIIMLIVVLPLVFFRVLPGDQLLTFLIAAPSVPPAPPPPAPRPMAAERVVPASPPVAPWPAGFDPGTVKGIPPPLAEPPVIGVLSGVEGLSIGIPGVTGLSGSVGNPGLLVSPSAPTPLPPPPPPRRPPLPVGGMVQEAKLIKRVLPEYPDLARRAHVEAVVLLDVTVDEEGNVADVRVIRGHPLLDHEAVRAVKQWKYSPTLLNGEPVAIASTVTVIFKLK